MLNLKRKISVILAMIMMMLAVSPVMAQYGNTYKVKGGETITVSASSNAGIYKTGYFFEKDGIQTDIVTTYSGNVNITVPAGEAGSRRILYVESVANNDNGLPNTITKTGWQKYYLSYPEVILEEDYEEDFEDDYD